MTLWITLTIVAQFINAIVALLDKYIVASGKVGRPIVLAFFTSVLSSLAVLIFIFGAADFAKVSIPSTDVAIFSFLGAVTFIASLYFFFSSFLYAEASDVVPVVSSISAISALIFSFYFMNTSLSGNFLWGFLFLVIGTFLIARFRMTKKVVLLCLSAGILFGLNAVLMKILFNFTNFEDGFFWSRIFITVSALGLLLIPGFFKRKENGVVKSKVSKSGIFLLLLNKTLAGIASILILKSIELGEVSVVQALAGMQFVFLVAFALFFGHKAPLCLGERCELIDRIQKIVSIAIIVTGFSLLFI